MKIIIVDDEQHARNRLKRCLGELSIDDVEVFDRSITALEYAGANNVDVAFLDIAMPEMNGVELAKALKTTNPFVNVIFCTGYTEYMQDAIDLHASGYLLKPAETESVKKALDNLLHPMVTNKVRYFAKTFGTFDFFVDGKPLHFKRNKSKEMLAYLVSIRGASANRKDLTAVLFGDKYDEKTQNYLSKIYKDLIETLSGVGASGIILKNFNSYSVDTKLFTCDLYDYDRGDPSAINAYQGEFMAQYDWALL